MNRLEGIPNDIGIASAVLFFIAVVHTLFATTFSNIASALDRGSIGERIIAFFGKVDGVFALWAAVLVAFWAVKFGMTSLGGYLSGLDFSGVVFVFLMFMIVSTRPILNSFERLLSLSVNRLPIEPGTLFFCAVTIVCPLLGSAISEPAAMTVSALLLCDHFKKCRPNVWLCYATLGLLFVNISVGGLLTTFASSAVRAVAHPWGWNNAFMLSTFGWRVCVVIVFGSIATALIFRSQLSSARANIESATEVRSFTPSWWVPVGNFGFLLAALAGDRNLLIEIPVLFGFLLWWSATKKEQGKLRLVDGVIISGFLSGLTILGSMQSWWLEPYLSRFQGLGMYWKAMGMAAITDSATLTLLEASNADFSLNDKYALIAGAMVGGGLTILANMPNPVGFRILKPTFGEDGISPVWLFVGALPYTVLAAFIFWI